MPDTANPSSNEPEEAMWELKVDDDGHGNSYPHRPGEPNCIYFLRTGACGYGSRCRFNHPTNADIGTQFDGELPQREGQPECQFFLKTGTCKFGSACKFHHPKDKQSQMNNLGLPVRQDEKSCPYYMKTGSCKFGVACKFNHPEPTNGETKFSYGSTGHKAYESTGSYGSTGDMNYGSTGSYGSTGHMAYGFTGSPTVPSPALPLISGVPAWSLSRSPYTSSPRVQGLPAYMPFVLPTTRSTVAMHQGWSMYMANLNPKVSADMYNESELSSVMNLPQSYSTHQLNLPERPDQPDCLYYLKHGCCKYGTSCKYHHPKVRNQKVVCTIGPLGLPLRPGLPVCNLYTTYGSCKYGSDCKFDHPVVRYYGYTPPPAFSVSNPPVFLPGGQRTAPVISTKPELLPSKASRLPEQNLKAELNGDDPSKSSTSFIAPHMQSSGNHSVGVDI